MTEAKIEDLDAEDTAGTGSTCCSSAIFRFLSNLLQVS